MVELCTKHDRIVSRSMGLEKCPAFLSKAKNKKRKGPLEPISGLRLLYLPSQNSWEISILKSICWHGTTKVL